MTKYALTMTPVSLSLEELLPSSNRTSYCIAIFIRTVLTLSTLVVALTVPFFGMNLHCLSVTSFGQIELNLTRNLTAGFVMALMGSLLAMLVVRFLGQVAFRWECNEHFPQTKMIASFLSNRLSSFHAHAILDYSAVD